MSYGGQARPWGNGWMLRAAQHDKNLIVRLKLNRSRRWLVLLGDVPRKNMPMPNDAYYASIPLRIDEFPAVDVTEQC
jgi:hypothetical protein